MSYRLKYHGHVDQLHQELDRQVLGQKEGRNAVELRHMDATVESIKKVADERSAGMNTVTLEVTGHADQSFANLSVSMNLTKGF